MQRFRRNPALPANFSNEQSTKSPQINILSISCLVVFSILAWKPERIFLENFYMLNHNSICFTTSFSPLSCFLKSKDRLRLEIFQKEKPERRVMNMGTILQKRGCGDLVEFSYLTESLFSTTFPTTSPCPLYVPVPPHFSKHVGLYVYSQFWLETPVSPDPHSK